MDDPDEVGRIGQIAVVQLEPDILLVGILVQVVDAIGVERGGATFDAMHTVAFRQQKFGQIGAVLSGNSGN